MRERKLTIRYRPLAVGAGLLLVGSFVVWRISTEPRSATRVPAGASTPSLVSTPLAHSTQRPAANAAKPVLAAPTVADLLLRCPELLDQPDERYPTADRATEDCRRALDARFQHAPTAETLVPLARPMAWRDVFDNVAERFDTVSAASANPQCEVAYDELRPHLAERCAARSMAELAVFKEICSGLVSGSDELRDRHGLDYEAYLTVLSQDGREDAIAALDTGFRYTGNTVYPSQPAHVGAALNARLVDQSEYWRQRERIDQDYFRTAWVRSKCEAERMVLDAMLPRADELRGLMDRAAGLGDEFALANQWQSRARALKLRELNLPLAWAHLGSSYSAEVHGAWKEADERAWEELLARPPHFANRLRQVEMAGVECPSPCTSERLSEIEERFKREIANFRRSAFKACEQGNDCALVREWDELDEPLSQAMHSEEWDREETRRRQDYGKRAEALRLRYTFAVEELAARTGVPVRVDILRRVLADPEVPWYLDHTEMEFVRTEARELVAEALARGG